MSFGTHTPLGYVPTSILTATGGLVFANGVADTYGICYRQLDIPSKTQLTGRAERLTKRLKETKEASQPGGIRI
ncbi:hypothetical protein BDW60DRAFT_179088 [Aspergillus nidulans var. acristatus]